MSYILTADLGLEDGGSNLQTLPCCNEKPRLHVLVSLWTSLPDLASTRKDTQLIGISDTQMCFRLSMAHAALEGKLVLEKDSLCI